jgi:acyl-CoA reductase-like NAD-dependent aldehyde dehydrogenase
MSTAVLHFVGGQWRPGTATFRKINPSNTLEVAVVAPDGSADDALDALDAASAAVADWAERPILERARFLVVAADLLASRSSSIATDIATETGKTISDSVSEVARAVTTLRYMAGLARRHSARQYSSASVDTTITVGSRPLGIVGQVSPWNLPLASAAWKVGPALVAGNAVVLKVASESPHAAFHFAACFDDAGLPAGVLSVLTGEGGALGGVLITDERVAAMSWTGTDVAVATIVRDNCISTGKRLQLQLGGINSLIVSEDANLATAVSAAILGAFSNAGQLRTSTRRVLVARRVYNNFRDLLLTRLGTLIVGSALDEETDVGPMVNAVEWESVRTAVSERVGRGDRLLAGGAPVGTQTYLFAPTVLEVDDAEIILRDEEVFGPVLTIAPFDDVALAIGHSNTAARVVSAGIITESSGLAKRFQAASRAGQIHINGPTIGAEPHVPYTGDRFATFGGPELGRSSLDFYSQGFTSYHHEGRRQ